jgi:hypothetical protein
LRSVRNWLSLDCKFSKIVVGLSDSQFHWESCP